MKYYLTPQRDEPDDLTLEEQRYLAARKREWYHDFYRLLEENETDYKYEEDRDQ